MDLVVPWSARNCLSLATLHKLRGDTLYAEAALGALPRLSNHPFHSNFSQCHGMSGIGELVLDVRSILNVPRDAELKPYCDKLLAVSRRTNRGGLHGSRRTRGFRPPI